MAIVEYHPAGPEVWVDSRSIAALHVLAKLARNAAARSRAISHELHPLHRAPSMRGGGLGASPHWESMVIAAFQPEPHVSCSLDL